MVTLAVRKQPPDIFEAYIRSHPGHTSHKRHETFIRMLWTCLPADSFCMTNLTFVIQGGNIPQRAYIDCILYDGCKQCDPAHLQRANLQAPHERAVSQPQSVRLGCSKLDYRDLRVRPTTQWGSRVLWAAFTVRAARWCRNCRSSGLWTTRLPAFCSASPSARSPLPQAATHACARATNQRRRCPPLNCKTLPTV